MKYIYYTYIPISDLGLAQNRPKISQEINVKKNLVKNETFMVEHFLLNHEKLIHNLQIKYNMVHNVFVNSLKYNLQKFWATKISRYMGNNYHNLLFHLMLLMAHSEETK